MIKKTLLTLGTASSIIAPLTSVIACTTYAITDEENEILTKLKTTEAINRLERTWLEVPVVDYLIDSESSIVSRDDIVANGIIELSELVKLDSVKDIFKIMTESAISSNSKFWIDLLPTLTKDPLFSNNADEFVEVGEIYGTEANVGIFGLNGDYIQKVWYDEIIKNVSPSNPIIVTRTTKTEGTDTNGDANITLDTEDKAIEFFMETILTNDEIGFLNEIYKTLLSREFLQMSREDWDTVFGDDYRDLNNLDDGTWKNIHESIQTDKDFPMVKFALDNLPFMEWNVSLDAEVSIEFASVNDMGKMDYSGAASHMSSANLADVSHENTTVKNVSTYYSEYNYGDDFNKFGVPSGVPNFGQGAQYDTFMGFGGLTTRGQISYYTSTESGGNKKLDISINKLKEVVSPTHYVGFVQDGTIITQEESGTDQVFELLPKDLTTVSLSFMYGLLPLYNTENDANIFTFDAFKDEDGNDSGSVWADNKDLLALYFYNSDTTGIWNEVKEFIMHEDGGDHLLTIHDSYMFEIYQSLGIDYIQEEE